MMFFPTIIPEFWANMVKGSAHIRHSGGSRNPAHQTNWTPACAGVTTGSVKEPAALAYLEERLADGTVELTSDAWLGVGVK